MSPDIRPDPDRLRVLLSGTRWQRVEVVASTGSTNADLIERSATDEVAGTVLITTDQTAGRGRHARVWQAPPGSQIAISAAVAVGADDTAHLGWLSLIAGMSAASAIGTASALRPTLKWPNDVLIDGRKLAGILSEYTMTPRGGLAVIGIGINTEMAQDQLPVATATSLRLATGRVVDLDELAGGFLRALDDLLGHWPADIEALAERYRERCDTLGARVRLILPGDQEVIGTAVGVDADGRIIVDADGRQVIAAAGDVTHLRPL
ncbi:biotin--[acetyl-CoA-carboxylase] ligase [Gordonia sp. ABSL1-1]|uniref:biotin--[acetyl-CoA-carboxylase] ligase n=1 Tax=Gordonia sp. ABSL1-1 TaxID=3053923 RepID=UPI002573B6AD|nr:biotin--[acetyl-CoA-carboxylase] ligase [Gordonia sp. ABSL1-1]MDL9937094.1 biotin--[acetyl-CoA-carboxylase] ligase [Gordonia sp. ABSL1-1]